MKQPSVGDVVEFRDAPSDMWRCGTVYKVSGGHGLVWIHPIGTRAAFVVSYIDTKPAGGAWVWRWPINEATFTEPKTGDMVEYRCEPGDVWLRYHAFALEDVTRLPDEGTDLWVCNTKTSDPTFYIECRHVSKTTDWGFNDDDFQWRWPAVEATWPDEIGAADAKLHPPVIEPKKEKEKWPPDAATAIAYYGTTRIPKIRR